jgi:hypothetical protein
MQRIIEMLAKLDANQEKAEADRKPTRNKGRPPKQKQMQEMMKTMAARLEKMDNSHKEMAAETKPDRDMEEMACRETTEAHLVLDEKTMACQEMEARPEEKPTSVDRKPEAIEERQFPEENAEVIPVGELRKKRLRDRKPAAERRRQKLKDLTREDCKPQK